MFNFLRPKKKGEPEKARQGTEKDPLSYDPNLINRLIRDHQQLLKLAGEIDSAFKKEDYEAFYEHLGNFRFYLQAHLLSESTQFYNYLEHHLKEDEVNRQIIQDFRLEMNDIARAALTFVKKYHVKPFDMTIAPIFPEEMTQVSSLLVKRISREEEALYPLYVPRG